MAYGFLSLQHLYNTRVNEVGIQRVWQAIQETLDEHNRVVNALMDTFVERTTVAQEQIELPGSGTLQPIGEDGNPLPVAPSGSYQVAYPIQGGATAWGDNRVSRQLMTVQEAARNTQDALLKDRDWTFRHIMAALFDNATWTYTDKTGAGGTKGLGSITIQPLANGDSVTYLRRGGSHAVDTHHLAQASAIDNSNNPFPTIRTELIEHPSNGGPFVAYIPTNLVSTVTALTEFVEADDPDIRYGADSDTLPVIQQRVLGFGDEVLGKTKSSNMWIVEASRLPDSYMLATALGNTMRVLKMREYPTAALQGFFMENFTPDGNHAETRMIRYAGFGVSNRVGAVVMRIGNGSYAIPTGYDAPLAV